MTGMTALALGEKLKRKEIGVEEAVLQHHLQDDAGTVPLL